MILKSCKFTQCSNKTDKSNIIKWKNVEDVKMCEWIVLWSSYSGLH